MAAFGSLMWRALRGTVLLTLAITLFLVAMSSLRGQDAAVLNEHRLTAVETKIDNISRDLADLRSYKWIELFAMSGLLGEAGLRAYRSKRESRQSQ